MLFFRWNIIAYSWLDVCLENERTFWFKYECSGSALFSVYWRCAVELSIRETPYQKWYKGVQKVAMCICFTESNSFDCHNQCYCLKWKDNKRSYLHKLCSHSNHNTNILLLRYDSFYDGTFLYRRFYLDFDLYVCHFVPARMHLAELIFCDCFLFGSKYSQR